MAPVHGPQSPEGAPPAPVRRPPAQVSSRTDPAESCREEDGAASQSLRLDQDAVIRTGSFSRSATDPRRDREGIGETAAALPVRTGLNIGFNFNMAEE
ncbi:MAG: hypothetical protein LBP23_07740 [Treponema sp.]|nr:hypothetical protein [Treponema sp.]